MRDSFVSFAVDGFKQRRYAERDSRIPAHTNGTDLVLIYRPPRDHDKASGDL